MSIFIHCFLLSSNKQTFMDYVMGRRSSCRRRIRNVVIMLHYFPMPNTFPVPTLTAAAALHFKATPSRVAWWP